MDKQNLLKTKTKGGEVRMKTKLIIALIAVAVFGVASVSYAAVTTNYTVKAFIPALSRASQALSKVTVVDDCKGVTDTWITLPVGTTLMDFGTLYFDTSTYVDPVDGKTKTYNIWKAGTLGSKGFYYALDLNVLDNTGMAWTIEVKKLTSVALAGGIDNLDNNINAAFSKVVSGTPDVVTPLANLALNDITAGRIINKADVSPGWLRVYFGLATGRTIPGTAGCSVDAPNVLPITASKPTGQYSGTVQITFAP